MEPGGRQPANDCFFGKQFLLINKTSNTALLMLAIYHFRDFFSVTGEDVVVVIDLIVYLIQHKAEKDVHPKESILQSEMH